MAKDIKYIFNSYIRQLPKLCSNYNVYCGRSYDKCEYAKHICVYFIVQRLSENEIKSLDNYDYDTFYDSNLAGLNEKIKQVDFKLLNVNEKTFNKDNFEEHEYSYQRLRDVNVKKDLFPQNETAFAKDKLKNCNVTKSIDYDAAKTAYLANNKYDKKYLSFVNDYGIDEKFGESEVYKANDYFRLSVKEDKIIENEIVLVCDDLQYFENTKNQKNVDDDKDKTVLKTGIYGFLLTYKDEVTAYYQKNHNKSKFLEIPIMLYQYAKPTYSNYNKIKLVFNVNGLFGVV